MRFSALHYRTRKVVAQYHLASAKNEQVRTLKSVVVSGFRPARVKQFKARFNSLFTTSAKLPRLCRAGRSRLRNRSPNPSHLKGHETLTSRSRRLGTARRDGACRLRQVPEA